jgi:oxygen-dependent protoporphyrinogen oxidase
MAGVHAMKISPSVVVVGAGISGLVVAWRLERSGLEVTVLEAEPRAGGTIGSAREQGCLVETGPNSTLDTSPLIQPLLAAVGLAAERIEARPEAKKRYVLRGGRLIALPLSPPALVATPLFSLGAKLALLREPFVGRGDAGAEETVAQFVRRRLGGEFLDYAINPFVAGVYAGDPERLSVRAAFPRLHELERRYGSLIRGQFLGARERRRNPEQSKQSATMFSFRDGMQALPDALAARLATLQLATRATALARDPEGGWTVSADGPAGRTEHRARAVVLAVPAYAASGLVRAHASAAADALDAIVYPPVAAVVSAYDRAAIAHALDGFGFLVPEKERRRILGTIFSSTLFENRAPEGTALLTTFVGGMRQPELASRDEKDIARGVHEELAGLLGAAHGPRWAKVARWARAIPQYTLGHLERMETLARAEEALPGLFFCANYRGGISVADCTKSGHATAERIAARLG